jgi:hypothetical protein
MPFQKDQFGHNTYDYKPAYDKLVDYSPDRNPSGSGLVIEDRGKDVLMALTVRGLGVLLIRGESLKQWHGVSEFTTDQIQFSDLSLL